MTTISVVLSRSELELIRELELNYQDDEIKGASEVKKYIIDSQVQNNEGHEIKLSKDQIFVLASCIDLELNDFSNNLDPDKQNENFRLRKLYLSLESLL